MGELVREAGRLSGCVPLRLSENALALTTTRDGGTDFTDCPFTALAYATGRKGTVLVLDVPDDHRRLREELWLHKTANRFMIWGDFEPLVIHQIPAKELRAEVRRKGVVTLPEGDKSMILRRHIDRRGGELPRGWRRRLGDAPRVHAAGVTSPRDRFRGHPANFGRS